MAWGSGGAWGKPRGNQKSNQWQDTRNQKEDDQQDKRNQENDGMGPYGRPAENGFPLPEEPLWHGHAWRPEGVYYDQASGRFSDGYQPGPGDKPQF
jgi:hypothetical protein